MPRRKIRELPPLTPRAREVVTFVVNAVALGSQDNDGEIGVIVEKLGTTPGRLEVILRRLESWLAVESGFVYATVAALRWQSPAMNEMDAKAILRKVMG
jgi:hypothetical protein